MSKGEDTFAAQLYARGIPYEREVSFCPPRRYRMDFVIKHPENALIAVEIDGGNFNGGHSRGKSYESFCEKINLAQAMGWTVFRGTTAMIERGDLINIIAGIFE